MRVTMPELAKTQKGYHARKRIPEDVQDEYQRLFGQRWEAKLALPRTLSQHEAQARFREWLLEVDTRISHIRAKDSGEPLGLTEKQARALSGEWYRWYTKPYQDDPGSPESWSNQADDLVGELQTLWLSIRGTEEYDMNVYLRDATVQRHIRPYIADNAKTAQFLASKGITLTAPARELFLDFVLKDYAHALSVLMQRAAGDYSPDELPEQFPQWEGPTPKIKHKATNNGPWSLFEGWIAARQPARSTVRRYRAVFMELEEKFKARWITEDAAQEWIDSLISDERSAKTVRDTWLSAAKTVYNWAARRKAVGRNPFKDVEVTVPKKKKTREKAFTPTEASTILTKALASDDNAQRWVPWLCAYSGARAGEITQLRRQDIVEEQGRWVMDLTPNAGSIKSGEARKVPLHEHLIEQGFLDFVKSCGKGPLFYKARADETIDPTNPRTSRAEILRSELAGWVRGLGITHDEVSPLHSWRHLFKQIARRAGIDPDISDQITGHAPPTVGRGYGRPTVEDMAEALKKFPRYNVE